MTTLGSREGINVPTALAAAFVMFAAADFLAESAYAATMASSELSDAERHSIFQEWMNNMKANCRFPFCLAPSTRMITEGWGVCEVHAQTFDKLAGRI
ncbi:MAG: hypothetical protein AAB439_03585 [Patescibacteria group bacterium]